MRGSSKLQRIGLALVLLMAISGLALLVMFLNRSPASTGDPLYDAVSDWVASDYRARLKTYRDADFAGHIPHEVLENWQAQFADDPRLHELWLPTHSFALGGDQALVELESKAAAGLLRAEALLLLATLPELQDHRVRYIEQALSLDPEYSWSWYTRGFHRLELGDKAGALSDLRRGNSLPVTLRPLYFPEDEYARSMMDQQAMTSRLTSIHSQLPSVHMLSFFRNSVMEQVVPEDYRELPELLTELNRFATQNAGANYDSLVSALVFAAIASRVGSKSMDAIGTTDYEPSRPILLQVRKVHSAIDRFGLDLLDEGIRRIEGFDSPLFKVRERLNLTAPVSVYFLQVEQAESAHFKEHYLPCFEALATFDYANPKLTPELIALLAKLDAQPPRESD